ncbi:hypothetical protein ACF06X_32325 [Streptomyces sp. NPDC015346]|uniref:hypothetical protein n=1 Tax=Streptomyces sp. NPDC015346 TaxID=3364954 RepID=UPI0036F9D659
MRRRSAGLVLLLVLLGLWVTVLTPVPAARAGGAGDRALGLTVTVNTREESDSSPPLVRVGDTVVKRYHVVNKGEADLHGVRVSEPGVSVDCPDEPLAALGSFMCTAQFPARAGYQRATAQVVGDIPSLQRQLTATARSGFTGVGGALTLTETVTPGASETVVRYTLTNPGDQPLHGVQLTDPALGPVSGGIDCGGGGNTVPLLGPGASASCTAVVRGPLGQPGATGVASGSDRVTTVGPGGEPVAPPPLTARASTAVTLPEPEPEPEPEAATEGGAPGAPGSAAGAAAAAPEAPAAPGGAAAAGAAAALPVPYRMPVGPPTGPAMVPGTAVPEAGTGTRTAPPPPPPLANRPDSTAVAPLTPVAPVGEEGLLPRLRRRSRELPELGVVVVLLLLLIPAAIAAALLGSRPRR